MKIYSGFNWKSLKEPDKTKSLMLEEETDKKKNKLSVNLLAEKHPRHARNMPGMLSCWKMTMKTKISCVMNLY